VGTLRRTLRDIKVSKDIVVFRHGAVVVVCAAATAACWAIPIEFSEVDVVLMAEFV
jgi:hypothetical protein